MTFEEAATQLIVDRGDEYVDTGDGQGYNAKHRSPAPLPEGWRVVESVNDRQEVLEAPDGTFWLRAWESSGQNGWQDCWIQGPLRDDELVDVRTGLRLADQVEEMYEAERRIAQQSVESFALIVIPGDDPEKVDALRQALLAEQRKICTITSPPGGSSS